MSEQEDPKGRIRTAVSPAEWAEDAQEREAKEAKEAERKEARSVPRRDKPE
jgi:hypothetical protein